MQIIKKGKKESKNVTFHCGNCHCEFECEDDEYWENKLTATLAYPMQHECFANCPECHKVCKTYKRITEQKGKMEE